MKDEIGDKLSKYSCGPWSISMSGKYQIQAPENGCVAWTYTLEDAHLISAAPDLLEAAEAITLDIETGRRPTSSFRQLTKAIAKARKKP
ncbi:hypothetical protein [Pseudoteredinibacter isoporae]|uniref:hypothetical protein n=1 Tax=Pseudoteredinibacter isoporae TaxID=570281 RepID=UPI00333FC7DC